MRGGENWKHATTPPGVQRGEAAGVSFFDDEPDAPGQVAIYIRDASGALTPGRTVDLTTPGHAESVIGAWIKHHGAPQNNCADPVIRSRVAGIIAGADERAAADRLAAAAPELLAALRECVTDKNHASHLTAAAHRVAMRRRLDAISEVARRAIAKAEGRAS